MEPTLPETPRTQPQKRSKEDWQALIKQWQSSGLSQQKFCLQHGINVNTFNYRKRRLVDGQVGGRSGGTSGKTEGSAFVKVSAAEVSAVDLCLSLPNGCRLSWRGEVRPGYLKTLLAVLIS